MGRRPLAGGCAHFRAATDPQSQRGDIPGLEEAHADGAAHDARLGCVDQAAHGPRGRRGQRYGGEAKQYQVVLDPKRLAGYRLSLGDVQSILERNNAAVGGGYIEKNGESFSIRADAQFHSIEEIENTVVTSDADGTPVLVKNLGTVRIGSALRFGAVTKHGDGEIVKGTVMMLTGANSRDVVRGVKEKLAEIQRELPAGVEIRSYYDRAEFIGRMLKTVGINLAEGALLVAVVLFFTLGSFRGALIAAQFENFTRASQRLGYVAPIALAVIFAMLFLMFGDLRYAVAVFVNVPLALVGGVLALSLRGLPFSIPAAVGFIAVAGVAVLNGVVMAGELARRFAQSAGDAATEIRATAGTVFRPVITTALVAALGFIPMAISTHGGAEVQRPLATVVIGGILSSTVLGLIVLPVMLRLLVGSRPDAQESQE